MSSSTDLQSLKSRIDLVEVFRSLGVEVRAQGRGFKAHCPFHEDKTPSVSISPVKRVWNCFSCGQSGDVFSLLQQSRNLTFPEAVKAAREFAGEVVEPEPVPEAPRDLELLARVCELYHAKLPQGLSYLRSRGLNDVEMLRTFQVGYCDGTLPWTQAERPALQDLGLLNAEGKETMTGCVVVPLRDASNRIVSLYGRRVADKGHRLLRGPRCGWCYPVPGASELVVVEGVLDALACYQAGIRHVVALNGTQGLFPELQEWLSSHRLLWCLDGDEAGRQAASELQQQLGGEIMALPCKDPLEFFAHHDAAAFRALMPSSVKATTTVDGSEVCLRSDDFQFRARFLNERGGRFRALVFIEDAQARKLSDTFDLRSRKSRTSFARAALEKWPRLNRVEETLQELLELLESRLFDEEKEPPQAVLVSEQDRAEAIAFLQRPDLIAAILADLEQLGYVGEEENKLLVYLISLSRLTPKPLSGIILSGSGAGKSFLTEMGERLTPPEGVEFYSRLSQHALAFMDPYHLQGKYVVMEERAGGEAADYSIRSLQTRDEFVNAIPLKDPKTGKIKTVHNIVYGPIAYMETTTNPNLNPENTSRCFILQLDESREQTRRIQDAQRRARSTIQDPAVAERIERVHRNVQRVMEKRRVLIPFSEHLTFSDRYLRNRRDNERFLSLVSVIAFLHQFQRPIQVYNGVEHTVATIEDYEIAYSMAPKILLAAVDELSRWGRELLTFFQEDDLASPESPGTGLGWSRLALRERLSWPDKRLRAALEELVHQELLLVVRAKVGNQFYYRLNPESRTQSNALSLALMTPFELRRLLQTEKKRHLKAVDDSTDSMNA